MNECGQELCRNWGGDGLVCLCAQQDIEPDLVEPSCRYGCSAGECYCNEELRISDDEPEVWVDIPDDAPSYQEAYEWAPLRIGDSGLPQVDPRLYPEVRHEVGDQRVDDIEVKGSVL